MMPVCCINNSVRLSIRACKFCGVLMSEKKSFTSRGRQFCSTATPTEADEDTTPFVRQRKRILVDLDSIKQVYYFDTLGFVKRLEKNGFSRNQAEGITEGFVDVIHSTLDHQTRNMITKPQQEIMVQQLLAEISGIKKDMTILQKSDFSALQHDTEKQSLELKMLKESLDDEIQKIKGKITLDINLERGRSIEAHADSEKDLNKLHNKIDTGMANLRTLFEKSRNDVFKYAGGTVLTCASISIGLIRLWS